MKFLTDPRIRAACGVSEHNPYVFALPGGTAICISEAVRVTSQNADLQCPERVGCTLYRKYMATVIQSMDLNVNQMNWVTNHLGPFLY